MHFTWGESDGCPSELETKQERRDLDTIHGHQRDIVRGDNSPSLAATNPPPAFLAWRKTARKLLRTATVTGAGRPATEPAMELVAWLTTIVRRACIRVPADVDKRALIGATLVRQVTVISLTDVL